MASATPPTEIYLCLITYTRHGIPHPIELLGASPSLEAASSTLRDLYKDFTQQDSSSVDENNWPVFTGSSPMRDPATLHIIKRALPPLKDADDRPNLYLLTVNEEWHDPAFDAVDGADDQAAKTEELELGRAKYEPTWVGELYLGVKDVNAAAVKKTQELVGTIEVEDYEEDGGSEEEAIGIHAYLKGGKEFHTVVKRIPEDTW